MIIEILKSVFIGLLYLLGIGFAAFLLLFIYAMIVRVWRERK